MDTDSTFEREIRKEFFAFRNGIVADKLRRAGDPHAVIMGCLLADVMEIANRMRALVGDEERLAALAKNLWNDTASRECRLAAPMLFPPSMMTLDLAMEWCRGIESVEVADNLCHKLLRNTAAACEAFGQLIDQESQLAKYTGYRLLFNLLLTGRVEPSEPLRSLVQTAASQADALCAPLLRDIMEELDNCNA